MMRALFVLSPSFSVLWSKRFPSVESRAKSMPVKVDQIGEEEDVAAAFGRALAAHLKSGQVRERDQFFIFFLIWFF